MTKKYTVQLKEHNDKTAAIITLEVSNDRFMFAETWTGKSSTGERHAGGFAAQNKGEEHRCCQSTSGCRRDAG